MKCSYCGAEADHRKFYCTVCGTKLDCAGECIQKTAFVKPEQNVSQETTGSAPPETGKEFLRTHAAMEEIFGPEYACESLPKRTLPEAEEDYEFPVTPCTDWPVNEETDMKDSLPVYTTAPLRKDVEFAPVSVPKETEDPEPVAERALKLPEGRSLVKMVLFGLLTLGIYPTVIWSRIVTELNIAASRNDSKRTMPYFGMLILAPVTLSVFLFVWMHQFCNRVGKQLELRQCEFRFSAKDFWIWGVLGSLILVGPFVFTHKLMHSMNLINNHYNKFG